MQVVGKLAERKAGTFDKGAETITYDYVLMDDKDVVPQLGVELVRPKVKPPRDVNSEAFRRYAVFAALTPGTPLIVTVELDKFESLRYVDHQLVKGA